jgi:hypothetical protein
MTGGELFDKVKTLRPDAKKTTVSAALYTWREYEGLRRRKA